MRMAWSTVGAHIGQRPGQAAYQMLETRRRGSVLRLGNPKRGIVSRRRYHTLRAPDQPARRRRCSAESLHLRCVCPGDRPSRRGQDPAAGSRRFAGVWRRFPAEAYASELPDLSGPTPRAPQRNPAPARPAEGGAGSRGIRPPVRAAVVRLPLRVETPVSSCRRGEAAGRFEPACRSDGLIHGAR